jgi:leucyl aminopeptidase
VLPRAEGAKAPTPALSGPLRRHGVEGKVGQRLLMPGDPSTFVIGVGNGDTASLSLASMYVGEAARPYASISISMPEGSSEASAARAIAEGFLLGAYRFDHRKSGRESPRTRIVRIHGTDARAIQRGAQRGKIVGDATNWARELTNLPASDATPGYIAAEARRMARSAGVTCKVWPARALEQAGFGGIVGVGRGSPHEPQMVELTYKGAGARTKPIAFTGKGITFDSGGLDLKKPDEMAWMRSDKAGGAAALATVRAVAELGLKVNVIAAIPFAENMPGPGALRPGDVVTHRGGRTSEVFDTDAEGRVLVADALAFLSERRPAVILDSATLTDGSGLGPDLWAAMGTDHDAVLELVEAGREAGDAGWEIPLWTRYRPIIDSEYADVKNQGAHGQDSAMLAGLFLRDFVADDVPWVHVDSASCAWAEHENPPWPEGATGSPTRAFVRFCEQRATGD